MAKKASDFRYNTGETKVPWAAVGENYNAEDLMKVVEFLMQGEGEEYEAALAAVREKVLALDKLSVPPGKLSLGSKVEQAEADCDAYLETTDATFITNCTAGFEIAYKYVNLGPGDEVIVPAITFIATIAYPLSVGAKLVFADLDPRTLNMDPADVARKITSKTKIIVPVHLGGYPVDMDPIMDLAAKHDITVLEDAAHAFGAVYKGRKIGNIAHFTSFSLHEVKNCTSFGEGGILITTIPEMKPVHEARALLRRGFHPQDSQLALRCRRHPRQIRPLRRWQLLHHRNSGAGPVTAGGPLRQDSCRTPRALPNT